MTTPKQMEPNVNNALGNLLKGMMPTCTVLAENTQTFPDHPGPPRRRASHCHRSLSRNR